MIYDYSNQPRYFDKPWLPRQPKSISPELRRLLAEIEANPRFHVSRECGWYPRSFPSSSPGWG